MAQQRRSVLADLGEELTGIIGPVSLCMALTVGLVRTLNPEGVGDPNAVFLASAYYQEQAGDSAAQKLGGALANAAIFIAIIAALTFGLVLLFKHGFTKFIYVYMGVAGFSVYFVPTGLIALQLLQKWGVHMDWITVTFILFDFAVVGAVTLFLLPAPLLMKQAYLIVTGIVTAYLFTWVPEWTTWTLLLAMAAYDVLAVLVPGGPLKMLVELAQEREETIPALVYEARPVRRSSRPAMAAAEGQHGGMLGPADQEMATAVGQLHHGSSYLEGDVAEDTPLMPSRMEQQQQEQQRLLREQQRQQHQQHQQEEQQQQPGDSSELLPAHTREQWGAAGAHGDGRMDHDEEDEDGFGLPDSIKLGLGDFIFYSVVVGRAAMYDYLAVFACYLAIVAGLGATLLLLAMARKALPALPISISLAAVCYFLARFVMEPVFLPMTLDLIYF